MEKKTRKHNPNWHDPKENKARRQRERRQRKKEFAQALGFTSWAAMETAVLNGEWILTPANEGEVGSDVGGDKWLEEMEELTKEPRLTFSFRYVNEDKWLEEMDELTKWRVSE